MPKAQKTPNRQFPQLLLIEASAGSGKTHALSRRYVEYLLADGVPHNRLSNLLAITFTKNAAREMKERILDWLKRLALGADEGRMSEMQPLLGLEPAEISRRAMAMVDEAIERYSEFQVSTIDSFNNRLARASARELGFRPDFETTTSYAGLFDYALALMARDIGPGRDPELTARIDEFLEMLNIHGKDFPWDPQARMRAAFESFIKIEAKETDRLVFADQGPRIQRCLDGIRKVYDEVTGFAEKNGLPCKPDENLLRFIAGRDVAGILSRRSFHDGHTPVAMSKLAKKESRELGERTRRMWGRTAPIVSELAEAYAAALVAPYHIPYRHFKDRLARAKRRQGIHHIDDIARELSAFLSREMIPEVYLKLGASIHHYLVDEFQDTDPAQWRSLLPLLEEALASDGSAFLVGDLKQAIYMFRQADYRIMKRLRDEIGGEAPRRWLPPSVSDSARVATLGENHRSGRAIVDYAAMTFKKALPPLIEQGMFAGDRTGLCSYRQDPAGGNLGKGYVSVRHFPRGRDEGGEGDEDGGEGDGIREAAAETDRLRQALIGIVGDARRRGYGFHDIAVLARTNNELEQAIDWLTREGIPATSSSGLDVRQRRLVAEILALLRWLDSPIDNLSWAAVAGGRMLLRAARADGLPWDENAATGLLLAAGQRLGKGGYLFQECRREASFGPLWDRYFGELYKLSGFTPAYDLACLALERLRVLRCFPEEAAAVLRLLEAVNRLETGGATSVGDFLRECESGDPETFGLELPEHMDAVRLMTFYKAKGMGFPVVVNLISQYQPKGADHYHARGPGGITLYRIDKDIADRTRGAERDLAALREDFLADQQVQELNSLYVACTRARDELHNLVSYGPPDSKGVPASYRLLFPEFSDGEKAQGPGAAELEPAAVPAASSARHPDEWRPEAAWTGQRFSDARLGEFIHLVLEDIEYLPADPAPVIAGLMERHRRMAPSADAGELGRKLCDFLADPRVSRWFEPRDGRTVEREVEFIDRAGRIVRMDRVVRDPEGVTVLDFKTGRETPASEARHREQMSEYLEVLAEATACGPAAGVIAYWDGRVTEVRT